MIKFQYYPAKIKSNNPLGFVSLEYFINSIKNPKPKMISVFDEIEKAEKNADDHLKANLKQNNLYYFTPCVIVDRRRRYDNIVKFTGLLVLDYDHIDDAASFRDYLFETYPFIICSYLSPSKKGVKAMAKIPIVNTIKEYKSYYFGMQEEMKQYNGYDSTTKNAVLPLFQSIDFNLKYRTSYETWDIKGIDPNEYKYNNKNIKKYSVPLSDDIKKNRVIKIIESSIKKIDENGHPQLRSACIAAGGYVASNYIGFYECEQIIFNLIESNNYLQKGVPGYKKTATWAINEGMKTPIVL